MLSNPVSRHFGGCGATAFLECPLGCSYLATLSPLEGCAVNVGARQGGHAAVDKELGSWLVIIVSLEGLPCTNGVVLTSV